MAFPAILLGGLLAKAIGSLFKSKGENKANQAAYDAQRPYLEANNARTAVRGSLAKGVSSAYGIDRLFAPGVTDKLTTPIAVPQQAPANAGWLSKLIGEELGGAGGGILDAQRQAGPPAPPAAQNSFQTSILNGGTQLTRRKPLPLAPMQTPVDDTEDWSKYWNQQ